MKNQEKQPSKAIKISEAIHHRFGAEADRFGLTHKAYAEAALRYFLKRKINPSAMPQGMMYQIHQCIDNGFDRLIRIIIRQEKEKTDLLLRYAKCILQEQINTRILGELNLNTAVKHCGHSPNQLEVIREKNNAYARKRKAEITEIYNKRIFDQMDK